MILKMFCLNILENFSFTRILFMIFYHHPAILTKLFEQKEAFSHYPFIGLVTCLPKRLKIGQHIDESIFNDLVENITALFIGAFDYETFVFWDQE